MSDSEDSCATVDTTGWIQCDRDNCQKWRRVTDDELLEVEDGRWVCAMNRGKQYKENPKILSKTLCSYLEIFMYA